MQPFIDLALSVLFGGRDAPASYGVGLFLDGVEIRDLGYRRADARSWHVKGNRAEAVVEFGPFSGRVEFDDVWLLLAGRKLLRLAIQGQESGEKIRLLPGMRLVDTASVVFSDPEIES